MIIQSTQRMSTGVLINIDIALLTGTRLVNLTINELDGAGSGGTVSDFCNARLYQGGVVAGSPMTLKAGQLCPSGESGELVWNGDIPITQPQTLRVVFNKPDSGNLCTVSYVTANENERVILPGEDRIAHIVQVGIPKVQVVNGAADALTLNFKPPLGKSWRILLAKGTHNDTGQTRSASWQWYNGADTVTSNTLAIGSGDNCQITNDGGVNQQTGPLIANGAVYPRFTLSALTAGKALKIMGVVLEYMES